MDSSKPKQTEQSSPPNGRASNQLHVKHDGRKPLFASSANSQESAGVRGNGKGQPGVSGAMRPGTGPNTLHQQSSRRTNSESRLPSLSVSSNGNGSPSSRHIARPSSSTASSHRRPLSLAQAFKIAENEDHLPSDGEDDHVQPMDGSPSPAPRPWRTRPVTDQNVIRQSLAKDHLDTKGQGDGGKDQIDGNGGAQDAGRVSSNNEVAAWRDRAGIHDSVNDGTGTNIPALVPGIDDIPLPSIETAEGGFDFQIEDDFTAGDLQVSDSPRIRTTNRPFAHRLPFDESSSIDINSRTRVNKPGAQNTRLDEVRNWEVRTGNNVHVQLSPPKPSKPKVDEIRDLEVEVESKIPIPDRSLAASRNPKLDNILQREANPLSNRQLAANRLADIKEQNAMSRIVSPEKKRFQSNRPSLSEPSRPSPNRTEAKIVSPAKSPYGAGGMRIPDTPVTVYKGRRERETSAGSAAMKNDLNERHKPDRNAQNDTRKSISTTRGGQQGLLQQLARATSSSPGPEPEPEVRRGPLGRRTPREPASRSSLPTAHRLNRAATSNIVESSTRAHTREDKEGGAKPIRPTVGFAGLRRTRSTESTRSKRSSLHSEGDPVDRIEAEAKLFALTDNHSERGPSPLPDDKDPEDDGGQEATPRPHKPDPLSMPTPKIIGAFVETPAPASNKLSKLSFEISNKASLGDRIKRRNTEGGADSRDTASDPGTSDTENTRTKRAPPRRRAHSLPRVRRAPEISANPPSVKDDIKELRRVNNIEDSTIDEFDDILANHPQLTNMAEGSSNGVPSVSDSAEDDAFESKMEQSLAEQQAQAQLESDAPDGPGQLKIEDTMESDLAAYQRMTKSLATSLHGIRDAKKGMERLGDSLSHTQHHARKEAELAGKTVGKEFASHTHDDHSHCAQCASHPSPNTVAYIHLPVPRLFTRTPHFRLTLLGLLTLVLSLWCVLESSMCAKYCSPSTCSSPPCTWSYDDPSFGVALPVKVDAWVTGGAGRVLFNHAAEEVKDWFADVLDAAYGRDIRDTNIASLSFEGRRTYRRRLRKKGIGNATQHHGHIPAELGARWDGLDDDDDGYTSIGDDRRVI